MERGGFMIADKNDRYGDRVKIKGFFFAAAALLIITAAVFFYGGAVTARANMIGDINVMFDPNNNDIYFTQPGDVPPGGLLDFDVEIMQATASPGALMHVTSTDPHHGRRFVPSGGFITINFSRPVNKIGSVHLNGFRLNSSGWHISASGYAVIIPYRELRNGWHTVYISDFSDGTNIAPDYAFRFEVGAFGGAGTDWGLRYLFITSTNPVSGQRLIPKTGVIAVNFSGRLTRFGNIFINGSLLSRNAWHVSPNGLSVVINPDGLSFGWHRIRLNGFGNNEFVVPDFTFEIEVGAESAPVSGWIFKATPSDGAEINNNSGMITLFFDRRMSPSFGFIDLPGAFMTTGSWSEDGRTYTIGFSGLKDGAYKYSGTGFRSSEGVKCPDFVFEFKINAGPGGSANPPTPTPTPVPEPLPTPPPVRGYTPPAYYGGRGVSPEGGLSEGR